MVCAQSWPVTLHWTSAAFRERRLKATDLYIAAMCRPCADTRFAAMLHAQTGEPRMRARSRSSRVSEPRVRKRSLAA
jgi:hypothetical protein